MSKIDKVRDQLREILLKVAFDGMDCKGGILSHADVEKKIDELIDEILLIPEIVIKD